MILFNVYTVYIQHARMCVCMYVCMYVCIYTHTRTRERTHTHTQLYIHEVRNVWMDGYVYFMVHTCECMGMHYYYKLIC